MNWWSMVVMYGVTMTVFHGKSITCDCVAMESLRFYKCPFFLIIQTCTLFSWWETKVANQGLRTGCVPSLMCSKLPGNRCWTKWSSTFLCSSLWCKTVGLMEPSWNLHRHLILPKFIVWRPIFGQHQRYWTSLHHSINLIHKSFCCCPGYNIIVPTCQHAC